MADDLLPVSDIEVPAPPEEPRDALVRSLRPAFSEGEERDLVGDILSDYTQAIQDRMEWETRLAEWEAQYYGQLPKKDYPWEGCANFNVPITMIGVETYKPRLIESVLGETPPILTVPIESADETQRDRVEVFLNWQILTELDLAPVVSESAHLFLQPGTVVAKTYWQVKRTRRKFIREFPVSTELEQIFLILFKQGPPKDLKKTGNLEWSGSFPSSPMGGPPLEVKIRFQFLESAIQVLVDHEELTERPAVDLIDPIDFVVPVKGGGDVQTLPWCQHRLWLFEDDLRRRVQQKRLDAEAVEELIRRRTTPDAGGSSAQDAQTYREGKAQTEGVEDTGATNVQADQYEIIEDYRRRDVDDDGYEEEIVCWVSPALPEMLLGWDYLDNVLATGRRPFRVGRFFPIPFRFYGLSFAEVVRSIQDEMNSIHNQRVDYGTIQNLPMYFYRASSTHAPMQYKLRPGDGVPLDNPSTDVYIPHWQGTPAFGQAEEALLHQYYERLTGLTDLALGRQPNRVGATRTASGTATLLSESGLRFKTAMEAFQRFWTGIFEDILSLDQEYLPPGKEFRVTGRRPEFIRLTDRMDIRGRYDIRLAATSNTLNRSVMREDAAVLLQATLNPALIQAGLIGLRGVHRALADLYRAYGKDPDLYLEVESAVRSPDEELSALVSGAEIAPSPAEPLARHLAAHQEQRNDPLVRGVLGPEGLTKLERHIEDTMALARAQQLAMALQQGQGEPPMAGAQAVNAQIGRQAPQPNMTGPAASAPTSTTMPMMPGGNTRG